MNSAKKVTDAFITKITVEKCELEVSISGDSIEFYKTDVEGGQYGNTRRT